MGLLPEPNQEANQTRDYCGANSAPHRAARPGPIRSLMLSLGRLFAAQKRLAQDDNQTVSLPFSWALLKQ
jgi:hypothetical protein